MASLMAAKKRGTWHLPMQMAAQHGDMKTESKMVMLEDDMLYS
jgi:hypothetical protein